MDDIRKFHNLEKEKQVRILNAALMEFAEKGYEYASTNKIVQNAKIGKGMLFYYFQSKQQLYHYLIDYSLNLSMDHYLNKINDRVTDLFDQLKQMSHLKLQFFHSFPEVSKFLQTVILIDGLPKEFEERFNEMKKMSYDKMNRITEECLRLFRDDIDSKKAYQLIQWMIKGYETEMLEHLKGRKVSDQELETLFAEFDEYLFILRKIFY